MLLLQRLLLAVKVVVLGVEVVDDLCQLRDLLAHLVMEVGKDLRGCEAGPAHCRRHATTLTMLRVGYDRSSLRLRSCHCPSLLKSPFRSPSSWTGLHEMICCCDLLIVRGRGRMGCGGGEKKFRKAVEADRIFMGWGRQA